MVVVSAATRVAGGAAVTLVLTALLVGCGDDEPSTRPTDDGSTRPTASGSSTGVPTTDPTDAASSEASDPSGSSATSAAPAAGLLLREETSQLHAPEGDWQRIPDIVDYATAVGSPSTAEVISLSDRENFAVEATLDEQVRFHNKTLPPDAIIERQPDVLLDGQPAYYVQWYTEGDLKMQHDIGVDRLGRVVEIQMDLDRDDAAASAALVEAVVASFVWR